MTRGFWPGPDGRGCIAGVGDAAVMQPFVNDDPRVGKAQWIRLADVLVIGPLMIWGGVALHRNRHPLAGALLGIFGAGTVVLNGYNFVREGGFSGGLR